MRRSMQDLLNALERHGVRMTPCGQLQVSGDAPAGLLMIAHRNRRALSKALSKAGG